MKWIVFILNIVCLVFVSCDEKEGYLITEHAVYEPDSMIVRLVPDPELDEVRMEYQSPWQSLAMQGYEGTERIDFTVESVSPRRGGSCRKVYGRVVYPGRRHITLSLRGKISGRVLYRGCSFDGTGV